MAKAFSAIVNTGHQMADIDVCTVLDAHLSAARLTQNPAFQSHANIKCDSKSLGGLPS
jgi:hypothetical protein